MTIVKNKIKENISLKAYTTFKIGGPVKYFWTASDSLELETAVKWAKEQGVPFFVLGGGSNLLVSDNGFGGLVLHLKSSEFQIRNERIIAAAGLSLAQLGQISLKNSLSGLEWSFGIPGTLGGAVFGNAGAFGQSLADALDEVEYFDAKDLSWGKIRPEEGEFGYRSSIFKSHRHWIIVEATFKLKAGEQGIIKQKMRHAGQIKKESQPLDLPSAGSIFKNPAQGPSAGELVEQCGLKGFKIGEAQISEKHANFIVNLGRASAHDVCQLIALVKQAVQQKFGIALEEEIQYLGF